MISEKKKITIEIIRNYARLREKEEEESCLYVTKVSSSFHFHYLSCSGPFEIACLDDPLPQNSDCVETGLQEPDQPSPTPSAKDYSLFHSSVR